MITENYALKSFLTTLLLILILASCNLYEDFPPPAEKPPQTRMLRVEILPSSTLAPGDTAIFRCIIADSLNSKFTFYWALDGDNNPDDIITDDYEVVWIAPSQTRTYGHLVSIDNGSKDSAAVSKEFEVTVE